MNTGGVVPQAAGFQPVHGPNRFTLGEGVPPADG